MTTKLIKVSKVNNVLSILQALEESNFMQMASSIAKPIYTNKDLMEMLNVKDNTLRFYRGQGYLGYSKFNDKIWYTQKDVLDFINHPKFRHEPVV